MKKILFSVLFTSAVFALNAQDSLLFKRNAFSINIGLPSFTVAYEQEINKESSLYTQAGLVLLFPMYHDAMFFQKYIRRKDETILGNWASWTLQTEYRKYLPNLKTEKSEKYWTLRAGYFSKQLFIDNYQIYMPSYRLGAAYGIKRKLGRKLLLNSSFGLAAHANYDFTYAIPAITINNRIGFVF